jgi:alpha-L-fucosidase 2
MGTEAFKIAVNTAEVIFQNDVYKKSKMGCSGHAPCPVVAARLGLKEDTKKLLQTYVEKFQLFPNGFTHYSDMADGHFSSKFSPRILDGNEKSTDWEAVHEKSQGDRILYSSENFIHMYYEAAANIMAGINEMLLQSYDGVIRVFPGVTEKDSCIFTLLACGNFLVTSEKKELDIKFIHVLSNSGDRCKILIPWEESIDILINDIKTEEFYSYENIVELDTRAGDRVLIYRKKFPLCNYYNEQIISKINNNVKKSGKATLGIERDF